MISRSIPILPLAIFVKARSTRYILRFNPPPPIIRYSKLLYTGVVPNYFPSRECGQGWHEMIGWEDMKRGDVKVVGLIWGKGRTPRKLISALPITFIPLMTETWIRVSNRWHLRDVSRKLETVWKMMRVLVGHKLFELNSRLKRLPCWCVPTAPNR